MNTQIQNYVTNVMEPLLTLSYNLGNDYPHEAVGEIWKLLFENALTIQLVHVFQIQLMKMFMLDISRQEILQ